MFKENMNRIFYFVIVVTNCNSVEKICTFLMIYNILYYNCFSRSNNINIMCDFGSNEL